MSYVKTKYTNGEVAMARIIDGEKKNLIGGNLKKLRRRLKVSQQTLSNKLELLGVYICRGSVSRIEDYSRTVTDIELFAIAEALGVDIKELYHEH
jgi:transcriptional regulator with XRE-family HTH domain